METLQRLSQRIRWKRRLCMLHRFAWMLALVFSLLFLSDLAFGMRTLSLRIAFAATLLLAIGMSIAAWLRTARVRPDSVGLAQLLERRYPALAERLVTLVQIDPADARNGLVPLFEAETNRRLADIEPTEGCPLVRERKQWLATFALFFVLFAGLAFTPAFRTFTERFANAWVTPLTPFTIEVRHGSGYALRGQTLPIEATLHWLDPHAAPPTECELVCEYEAGMVAKMPMTPTDGKFVTALENLRQPVRCRVEADGVASATFSIQVIEAPIFVGQPSVVVTPPSYMNAPPVSSVLDASAVEKMHILRYSKMHYHLALDQKPIAARLHVVRSADSQNDQAREFALPVLWTEGTAEGTVDAIAKESGAYEATLVLELEHGLRVAWPLGRWSVHDDQPPRFTQPLRLIGGAGVLESRQEYRIAPNDSLKLQTAVEDDEGLGPISFEYRLNDGAAHTVPWLHGKGHKELAINDWLPLPGTLKAEDRVQFRVRAADNRRLRKGEITQSAAACVPAEELHPQVAIAPANAEDGWITLRVDRAVEGFVKKQTQAQADEVIDIIAKIKKKLQNEAADMAQLQRTIHQQTALMPAQAKQAEKLQALNREIMVDLNSAGERFLTNPALANLAAHFFDIAETELQKSHDALDRFRDKERPLPEAEKELPIAQDALAQAAKKLERMLDWNKMIAQDRLDQWQIENLEKRQKELAERLAKLLEQQPLSDAELAKQIEAIRQEQAKLAEQTEQLQKQSRLVQESLASLEQMRMQKLAQVAKELAAEQQAMRELDPAKMPAEIRDRLAKLAERQNDLANRSQPYALKNEGPDVKPAAQAAAALKIPMLGDAIEHQHEHEKRLQEWFDKLLPGVAVNRLREQVVQLAKTQKSLRDDLEKLGKDLANLNDKMLEDRLRDLVKRQKELHAAIAKVQIDRADQRQSGIQQSATQTAQQAAEQLAAKDALTAFESMEKAQQHLQALAGTMPTSLPVDRKKIKDAAVRERIEQVEKFEQEQKKLRAETERLLADWMKAAAHGGGDALAEKAKKLAGDLMELSQKGTSPESKGMAKESAQTIDDAKKAMDASQAMKAKGDPAEAKKMDDEAANKLEFAVKQLAKLVQDQAMKNPPKENAEKTAESLKQAESKMRQADATLPKMPKDAQAAMQAAAKKLAEAANQLAKQGARSLPNPAARNSAAKASISAGGRLPANVMKELPLDPSAGKAWGELPGELKTRMLQDFRARFGEDHAEMIRQYFDRLAETPARKD